MKSNSVLLICFSLLIRPVFTQSTDSNSPSTTNSAASSKDRYLFPVAPGVVNTLAGTMGELRNTHFHSGLDIRTNNSTGAPVLAAQEGYISRATKSSFSYGNVLFIKHPNGHTTLYAHLNSFNGEIAKHVLEEQYKQKNFEIDIKPEPEQFKVKQGDTIGFSGNTGSSNGPHLHFDIRDKDMNALNPLEYGFEEIKDKTKPVIIKVALRTMDKYSRVNGKFGRFEFNVLKTSENYILPKSIPVFGKIGIEILAYDRMDNTNFQCGINEIRVVANTQNIFTQTIKKIEMMVTRGILSLMENSVLETKGYRYNKLYIDNGNPLNFYSEVINKGVIEVKDNQADVQVFLKDSYDNLSLLKFNLIPEPPKREILTMDVAPGATGFETSGPYLTVRMNNCKKDSAHADLFFKNEAISIKPDYFSRLWSVFIIDLRNGIPDSISTCHQTMRFGINDRIPSGTRFTYYGPSFTIFFPDSALFDTLYLSANHGKEDLRDILTVSSKVVPLLKPITIELKPQMKYNEKFAVYRQDGNRPSYLGGTWENGKVIFTSNKLGKFILLPDSIPPEITKIYITPVTARFKILDYLSGIASYEATINGQWLLMNYDYKSGILYSEKKDKSKPLKGDIQLKVTDNCGNVRIFKQNIL